MNFLIGVGAKCATIARLRGFPQAIRPMPPEFHPPSPPIPADADDLNDRSVALMALVKIGNHAAFTELVKMHQAAVIGTAYRMLGTQEDAQDLAQQVFVRIWKSAPRYEASAKFTTWMFTILRNLAFNEYRRRGRHPAQSLEASEEDFGQQLVDHQTVSADAVLGQKELEAAVDAAIKALPEKQRLAVSLRRYEELPYEEIAVILEMTVSAVKSLLFRARADLREMLAAHLGEV
jgi:RNA polymerase sigma-70 factor (ECF subfamily)